jgi:hypothetical protein
VVLCGLREVRDYRAAAGGNPGRLGTSSPFDIAVRSLRISDFTPDQVAELYGQPCSLPEFSAIPHLDDAVDMLLDSRAPHPAPRFIHTPGTVVPGDDPQSRVVVSCL